MCLIEPVRLILLEQGIRPSRMRLRTLSPIAGRRQGDALTDEQLRVFVKDVVDGMMPFIIHNMTLRSCGRYYPPTQGRTLVPVVARIIFD